MTEWITLSATLGLIGVTAWYSIQTQRMAKSSQEAARSAERAAESSARSAAIAAAGTKVAFYISPTYAIAKPSGEEGTWFNGIMIECTKAAVFLHNVRIESAWAPDPDFPISESEQNEIAIYPDDSTPALVGPDAPPTLMHKGEAEFFELPVDSWAECLVASMRVVADYSFDGREPLRSRTIEWVGQPGRDYGPNPDEG